MTTIETVLGVTSSLSGRRWLWRTGEERVAAGIAQRLDLPEIVSRLLAARGIGIDAAADFLEPTLRVLLPDPSAMTDMDVAADRLADAVRRGETVAVYGDYDVDGACSAALMVGFLRALGCLVHHHVPDRIKEGYGPNAPALTSPGCRGASLIVCVDCGTAAAAALSAVAGQAEVIVLDHHKAEGPPPPILATVNPNRLDDRSGLGNLCAAGVSFLTAIATVRALRRLGFFAEPGGTGPDGVAGPGGAGHGLRRDAADRRQPRVRLPGTEGHGPAVRPGIAALLEVTQAREKLNAATCGYALGPRINAGGRISEADLGLRLLLTEDRIEALALAEKLEAVNRMRQDVEAGIMEAAMFAAETQVAAGRAAVLVTGEGWHPGVVGIVAGRIKERFNRPACVAGFTDGLGKGSGRSVPGVDLGAAVIAARQAGLLVTGGGHAMAAGFSVRAERLEHFTRSWTSGCPLRRRCRARRI